MTSFTDSRQEVGLKRIFVICSEMTCALFAHIAPPAFLWCYFVDEGRRKANVFCQNLLSSLYSRKLQYLVFWWSPDDCHIYSRKCKGEVWNKFWYNVIVFIRVFSEKMRWLIIFIASAAGNFAAWDKLPYQCELLMIEWHTWHFRLIIYWSYFSSHLNVLICLAVEVRKRKRF